MWLVFLFVAMFIIGAIVLYMRLTPQKAIKQAKELLKEENPNLHSLEATISRLNLIEDRTLKDECIELARKLRAKQVQLAELKK